MEFDKSKGFCNGVYISGEGCEFTFHEVKHTHNEIALKNCKKCSCPLAKNHRKKYSEEKKSVIG